MVTAQLVSCTIRALLGAQLRAWGDEAVDYFIKQCPAAVSLQASCLQMTCLISFRFCPVMPESFHFSTQKNESRFYHSSQAQNLRLKNLKLLSSYQFPTAWESSSKFELLIWGADDYCFSAPLRESSLCLDKRNSVTCHDLPPRSQQKSIPQPKVAS